MNCNPTAALDFDCFVYNGSIERGKDFRFIDALHAGKQSERIKLILVTNGGDPDAAYKIGRYLQQTYSEITVVVPGFCKSAGTLLAIAAHELVLSPYGELGPLDIQLEKEDKIFAQESGLNIGEALGRLETSAITAYHNLVTDILLRSGGVVSFATASKCASEMVGALYAPMFARIDPEDVGSRIRDMRTGFDYGLRLNSVSQNLKDGALDNLVSTYSRHSFVIDQLEATGLFKRVRPPDDVERKLIDELETLSRFPQQDVTFRKLELGSNDETPEFISKGDSDDEQGRAARRDGRRKAGAPDGRDPPGSTGA